MTNFHKVQPNEITYPAMEGYKAACCDCGLVHNWRFEIVRVLDPTQPIEEDEVVTDPTLKIRLHSSRNIRSTAAIRREDKKRGVYRYRNLIEVNLTIEGSDNHKESVKTLVREMIKQGLLDNKTTDMLIAFIDAS